jgi:hypothetical protein
MDKDGYYNVTWTPPVDTGGVQLSGYFVQYIEQDQTSSPSRITNVSVPAQYLSTKISPTKIDVPLLVRVAAVNILGKGHWKNYQPLLLLNLVIEDPVFTEVSPSNSAIRVSWSMPNAGQYTYKIRAWARDGQDMQVMTTADTVATFRGLLASTEYFVDAVVSNQEGYDGARFPWPSSKRTTIVTAPSGPQNVRLVRASSSSITIAWDAPSEMHGSINVTYAARCVLEATVSSTNTSLNAGSLDYVGSALSTVMSGLSADSEYLCFVRSYNEAGGGPIVRSDITFSTMEASVPGPSSRPKRITLPGVTDVWSGVVVLEWQPPKDDGGIPVREYLVLMSYNGLSFEHLIGRAEIQYVESTVRATITRLSAEKDYYFRVNAINFKGTGAASPPSAVVRTPTAGLPSEPRSLQAFFSPQNSGKVRMAWQDPEFYSGTQTLTYVLERKVLREYEDICSLQTSLSGYTDAEKISGFNAQYDSLDQSELPTWARRSVADFEAGYQRVFKSTNETSGGKLGVVLAENDLLTESQASFLLYRVRAVSAVAGDGPTSPPLLAISPVGVTHQPTAPEIVSNVYTSLHANQVLLSWNMPDLRGCGPAHYVLLRYTKSRSGEWGEEPVRTIVTGSASTSTEVGLQHTTTYRWQIVAVNLAGESLPSEYSDEATTGKSPPTAVCSFSLEATAMDVVLDWSAPCDDGGSEAPYPKYQVQYWRKNYGGNWMHLIVPEGDTQYKHTFDREYFNQEFVFQVRARNLAGYGPWNRSTVRMLEPKVCPGKSRYGSLLPCSGHGTCHDFDGTCKCDYMYSGEACDTPNGVVVLLVIKGSIESFVPNEFRAAIAAELGIAMYRIPPEFMSFVSGSVKVTFSILNEHPLNTTAVTRDALSVIGLLERKMSRGDLVGLGAKSLSIVSVEGATASSSGGTLGPGGGTSSTGHVANGVFSIAPELPSCEVDVSGENPCTSCLAQSGCGWCAKSTTCMVGGERGPALAMGSCDTSDWSFNDDVCPPSAHDVCATHNTCGNCVAEDNAACAWCASSGSCLSENRGSKYCPWGWVPDVCVGSCERNKVMTSVNGILWLGDDTSGSVLQYKPLSDCKWTISPVLGDEESADARQQSYASQSNDFDSITVTFERVDLGYGDTVKVFDGQNELLLELQHSSGDPHVDQMPIEATTKTGIIVVDFLSDNSGSGTGFLAKYEAKPKTFWDTYLVVGFSSISMVACVCCFCCWMRCKPEEPGGRQIENSLGLDLQSTDRGATVTNIKKFPRFAFSENHKRVMDDIGQTSACTICLGDYENAEELRLLPCGHCFHAECVDAWLQINRVCPICKVDVYDLLVEESARKQREKKLKKQRKKQKRRREKKKKKKKKKLGNHVTPVRSDQDHTRIAVKRVPEVLDEEEEEVLTPMEEFRKRSRRLLIAGSRVHESATTGTSAGEEKLPEIEMSVLSDRPLSPPREHIRVARAPASLPIGSGVSSAGRQRPNRVRAPRTQQHPRTGSLNDGLTNSRGDGNLEVRARPLPLILSNSFTLASRDRGQRLRLPPAGRLPALTANARNISHRNLQNWTVNSQLSSERLEYAAQNSLDATVGAVSDLSIERPSIGLVVNREQNLPTPVLLTRFQQQSRRRSTINQDDTLLESTF